MKRFAFVLAAAALALGACDLRPDTATWDRYCADYDKVYRGTYTTTERRCTGSGDTRRCTNRPVTKKRYDRVCDEYAWRCLPGKDGTTVCQGTPGR